MRGALFSLRWFVLSAEAKEDSRPNVSVVLVLVG